MGDSPDMPAGAPADGNVRIARDDNCPRCGWPETFIDLDMSGDKAAPVGFGCPKCPWRLTRADVEAVIEALPASPHGGIEVELTPAQKAHLTKTAEQERDAGYLANDTQKGWAPGTTKRMNHPPTFRCSRCTMTLRLELLDHGDPEAGAGVCRDCA